MLDALNAPAAPPATIRREDYRPPDWLVPEISLYFELDPDRTIVRAELQVERNGSHSEPLRLDGEGLKLLSLRVDGKPADHVHEGDVLIVPLTGDRLRIKTEVEIAPASNTQLMGLYASAASSVRSAKRKVFAASLSSRTGRMCSAATGSGCPPKRPATLSSCRTATRSARVIWRAAATGRNGMIPSEALLPVRAGGGDLVANRDRFVTSTGREVDLGIWVRPDDLPGPTMPWRR
jgi:aminopeptidase N